MCLAYRELFDMYLKVWSLHVIWFHKPGSLSQLFFAPVALKFPTTFGNYTIFKDKNRDQDVNKSARWEIETVNLPWYLHLLEEYRVPLSVWESVCLVENCVIDERVSKWANLHGGLCENVWWCDTLCPPFLKTAVYISTSPANSLSSEGISISRNLDTDLAHPNLGTHCKLLYDIEM